MAQIGATVCEAVHGADLAEAPAMARAIRAVFDRYFAGSSDMTDEKCASAELAETREAERLRLAHGLHDTVVQQRLGLRYQLAAQGGRAAANEMAEFLNEARQRVRDAVIYLRGVIRELRPARFEEFGRSTALKGKSNDLHRQSNGTMPAISPELNNDGKGSSSSAALCLRRVAQEAQRNAIRHARAHTVTISIRPKDASVFLRVRDDGCGFRVASQHGAAIPQQDVRKLR